MKDSIYKRINNKNDIINEFSSSSFMIKITRDNMINNKEKYAHYGEGYFKSNALVNKAISFRGNYNYLDRNKIEGI